jgi:lipoprotein NlpI
MKKLVLFFAVIVAVSFASCGNKTEAPAEEVATEEVVAVEEAAPAADTAVVVEEAAPVAE